MLLNFSVKGFKSFYDKVHFTMQSNNRIKKNLTTLSSKERPEKNIRLLNLQYYTDQIMQENLVF